MERDARPFVRWLVETDGSGVRVSERYGKSEMQLLTEQWLTLGTFGWNDPHPHPQCPKCAEASHRELTMWLVDNHSESKQVLAEKLLKTFKVVKR